MFLGMFALLEISICRGISEACCWLRSTVLRGLPVPLVAVDDRYSPVSHPVLFFCLGIAVTACDNQSRLSRIFSNQYVCTNRKARHLKIWFRGCMCCSRKDRRWELRFHRLLLDVRILVDNCSPFEEPLSFREGWAGLKHVACLAAGQQNRSCEP
jgi:hypothetical protein